MTGLPALLRHDADATSTSSLAPDPTHDGDGAPSADTPSDDAARADATTATATTPADAPPPVPAQPARSALRSAWTLLRRVRVGGVFGALVLVTVVAWAVAPAVFAPDSPLFGNPADRLLPPSAEHLFGTDQLGRDVFTRFVHGSRVSLQAIAIALGVSAGAGILLGLLAGYLGGKVDDVVSRVLEVLLAIPGLLLSLAIIAALGFGTAKIGLAVGVAGIPSFARVMRAEVMRVRSSAFVEAARTMGARTTAVLWRHVLPATVGPVVVLAVLEIASAVLAVSALTFLGFGAPPPAPEWGLLVAEGRDYLATAWWPSILPGLAVAVVVVGANSLARSIESHEEAR